MAHQPSNTVSGCKPVPRPSLFEQIRVQKTNLTVILPLSMQREREKELSAVDKVTNEEKQSLKPVRAKVS